MTRPIRYVRSIDNWGRVEKQIAAWSELEREMRSGRAWTPIQEGSVFARFWRQRLLIPEDERIPPGGMVCVGIDHGLEARRQRAVLSVVYNFGDHQEVWTLAEYAPPDATTPHQDGEGIVKMVMESGISRTNDPLKALAAVDVWVGDRPIQKHRIDVRKSNRRILGGIRAHLAQHYQKKPSKVRLPGPLYEIAVPYKRPGSAWTTISFLQDLMIQGHTRFHPRCDRLIKDVQTWKGNTKDPEKDGIDAWRYPVEKAMRIYGVWRWK